MIYSHDHHSDDDDDDDEDDDDDDDADENDDDDDDASFPSGPCSPSYWEERPNQHQPASRCGSLGVPFDMPWHRSSTGVFHEGR